MQISEPKLTFKFELLDGYLDYASLSQNEIFRDKIRTLATTKDCKFISDCGEYLIMTVASFDIVINGSKPKYILYNEPRVLYVDMRFDFVNIHLNYLYKLLDLYKLFIKKIYDDNFTFEYTISSDLNYIVGNIVPNIQNVILF